MSRQKNELLSKIRLIDRILPLFGINGLNDYQTEISSRNDLPFEEITSQIPEIKQYFKVSQMGLSQWNYQVRTGRQALALLKHLCQQANIPFDLTKYKDHGTFALAPPNRILQIYLESKPPCPPVEERKSPEKRQYTVEEILRRPSIETEEHCLNLPKKFYQIIDQYQTSDTKSDRTSEGSEEDSPAGPPISLGKRESGGFDRHHPLVALAFQNNPPPSFTYLALETEKDVESIYHRAWPINLFYQHPGGKRFFEIPLIRYFDIVRGWEVVAYDLEGKEVPISFEGFHLDQYGPPVPLTLLSPQVTVVGTRVTNANIPVVALPFYCIRLKYTTSYQGPLILYQKMEARLVQNPFRANIRVSEVESRLETVPRAEGWTVRIESYRSEFFIEGVRGLYSWLSSDHLKIFCGRDLLCEGCEGEFHHASVFATETVKSLSTHFVINLTYQSYTDRKERLAGLQWLQSKSSSPDWFETEIATVKAKIASDEQL